MKVVRPSNSLGGLIISCLIIYLNLYNMQFNFRNLLVAGAAIFTLTACNNSDNDVFKAEESNLKVQIKLPSANPLSRALVDEAKETDVFKPCPSPLCHWCDYCKHKDRANDDFSKLCPYYSLWLPNCKTYEVNRPYHGEKAGDILKGADERKKFWF